MLIENTLFGQINKVAQAIAKIRLHEPANGYYVAFSGGKDSCVVLDLIKRAGVKYDAHYNVTTVEPPELLKFIHDYHRDVIIEKPEMPMYKLIEKKGVLPTRFFRYCCAVYKERGGIGRLLQVYAKQRVIVARNEQWSNRATGTVINSFYILSLIGVRKMYGSISRPTTCRTANCMIRDGNV